MKLLQSAHTVLLSAQLFISHPEKAKSKDLQTTDIKMLQMFCKHWPLLIVATNFTYKQCLPSLLGKSDCLQHTCSSGMDFCYGFIFQGFGDQKPQKCSHSMDIRYLTCFRLISVHHSAKQHRWLLGWICLKCSEGKWQITTFITENCKSISTDYARQGLFLCLSSCLHNWNWFHKLLSQKTLIWSYWDKLRAGLVALDSKIFLLSTKAALMQASPHCLWMLVDFKWLTLFTENISGAVLN